MLSLIIRIIRNGRAGLAVKWTDVTVRTGIVFMGSVITWVSKLRLHLSRIIVIWLPQIALTT